VEIVVFGKRARPPVGTSEPVRLGPRPGANSPNAGARRSESYAATKNEVIRALVDAIDPAQIAPLDPESKREDIRDLASDIIVGKNLAMSIAEQEDLLEDICNDIFGAGSAARTSCCAPGTRTR
jgi:pilus assembly protein CpaF